tara:strand:+ start:6952 stop:7215 length:264 start_codon:yes stop_codon:yes gene_type:complete
MDHIYEDLETIVGFKGLMTHMIPRALEAVTPWLKEKVKNPRFWDGKFDQEHLGEFELPQSTMEERVAMSDNFALLTDPLDGKDNQDN